MVEFQGLTPWLTPDLWIRRAFEVDLPESIPGHLRLSLVLHCYYDEDAEVYLNGVEIARFKDWSHHLYLERSRPGLLPLRNGRNVIAVHCHNGLGPGGLDLELALRLAAGDR